MDKKQAPGAMDKTIQNLAFLKSMGGRPGKMPTREDLNKEKVRRAKLREGEENKATIDAINKARKTPKNGIFVVPVHGQLLYQQWLEENEVIGQILYVAVPCQGVNAKGKEVKHITIEIHRMWTHPAYRKKGIMSKLIDSIKKSVRTRVARSRETGRPAAPEGRQVPAIQNA